MSASIRNLSTCDLKTCNLNQFLRKDFSLLGMKKKKKNLVKFSTMKNSTLSQRMVDNYKYHVNQKLQLRCNSHLWNSEKEKLNSQNRTIMGSLFLSLSTKRCMPGIWGLISIFQASAICFCWEFGEVEIKLVVFIFLKHAFKCEFIRFFV